MFLNPVILTAFLFPKNLDESQKIPAKFWAFFTKWIGINGEGNIKDVLKPYFIFIIIFISNLLLPCLVQQS